MNWIILRIEFAFSLEKLKMLLSGIGDINQFKLADQLVCYCGLIPTSYSPGTEWLKEAKLP